MPRNLPPLNALRTFEAAAAHMSFTLAADELHVTQAAVSHQIKTLEEWLGVPLFARFNRQLKLTDEGRAYLPEVRFALDRISYATQLITEQKSRASLTVCAMDSFAAEWLVPRLADFQKIQPSIDIWLTTWNRMDSLPRDNVDIEIRYGDGEWPDQEVSLLMKEEVFPVCSPTLIADGKLSKPEDLANCTLLHDCITVDWTDWLRAADVEGVDANNGPRFNHSHLMLRAAVNGEGVGLGRSVLAADSLNRGVLSKPFEVSLPAQFAYYIVHRPGIADKPKIKIFTDWLNSQAKK